MRILKENSANECVWNYLNGFFNQTWKQGEREELKYSDHPSIKELCVDKSNRFKLHTLSLISKEEGNSEEWRGVMAELIERDPTRKLYYQYMIA